MTAKQKRKNEGVGPRGGGEKAVFPGPARSTRCACKGQQYGLDTKRTTRARCHDRQGRPFLRVSRGGLRPTLRGCQSFDFKGEEAIKKTVAYKSVKRRKSWRISQQKKEEERKSNNAERKDGSTITNRRGGLKKREEKKHGWYAKKNGGRN